MIPEPSCCRAAAGEANAPPVGSWAHSARLCGEMRVAGGEDADQRLLVAVELLSQSAAAGPAGGAGVRTDALNSSVSG